MKIAFISDIHGNAVALEKVLEDTRKKSVDRIVVLGDLCYRGSDPKRCMELIRSLDAEVIKGNADEWVVRGVNKGEVPDRVVEMMNRERDWTVSRLTPSDIEYMRNLPTEFSFMVENTSFNVFHATPNSLFDIVPPDADDEFIQSKLLHSSESQITIYAHIHKPFVRYIKGRIIMNTGSVGLPFDGLPMASYAIVGITEGNISTSIERVRYDIDKVIQQYVLEEYPNSEMMIEVLRNAMIG